MRFDCLLFDLDGTLVDSREDLATAVNLTLAEAGRAPLTRGRVDVLAGRAAGMKTCGFAGGFRGRAELEEAGADFLIESFQDLRAVVEG